METTDISYSDIDWIKFDAGGCFGTCPVFKMTIHEDGTAFYHAIMFNKLEGKFKTVIKRYNHLRLLSLIKKADIFGLKSRYWVSFTDHPSYMLKIKLKNGITKRIEDYGPDGPDELLKVYRKIFSLRETEDWK